MNEKKDKDFISAQRVDALNHYVKAIIDNDDVYNVYMHYKSTFETITPFDVFQIMYWLEENNLSIDKIKSIAGKLINTFRIGLLNFSWEKDTQFIKYLFLEAAEIRIKLDLLKPFIKEGIIKNKEQIKKSIEDLAQIEKRFLKMEYIIFPHIEKQINNPRPLSVMWSLYDDAVSLNKKLIKLLDTNDIDIINKAIGKYFFLIYGILEKEELLVLPVASKIIDNNTWNKMLSEAGDYGFCFIKVEKPEIKYQKENQDDQLLFSTITGGLALEELILILDKIGLDITYVDQNNKVKFYNNPINRIFPRSPSIIGRDVRNCHPPDSVHIVEEIIEHFRKGLEDEAKFWINYKNRFLVITYYAIRNEKKEYKGVLEMSQDATNIKKLEGENRLLQWKE